MPLLSVFPYSSSRPGDHGCPSANSWASHPESPFQAVPTLLLNGKGGGSLQNLGSPVRQIAIKGVQIAGTGLLVVQFTSVGPPRPWRQGRNNLRQGTQRGILVAISPRQPADLSQILNKATTTARVRHDRLEAAVSSPPKHACPDFFAGAWQCPFGCRNSVRVPGHMFQCWALLDLQCSNSRAHHMCDLPPAARRRSRPSAAVHDLKPRV
jgi:hypothetical protein